jgi:potassium channel
MVLTFNKAILDNDTWNIVDDRKQIAITYLKTWFIVDLLSCLPFGLFHNIGDKNLTDE